MQTGRSDNVATIATNINARCQACSIANRHAIRQSKVIVFATAPGGHGWRDGQRSMLSFKLCQRFQAAVLGINIQDQQAVAGCNTDIGDIGFVPPHDDRGSVCRCSMHAVGRQWMFGRTGTAGTFTSANSIHEGMEGNDTPATSGVFQGGIRQSRNCWGWFYYIIHRNDPFELRRRKTEMGVMTDPHFCESLTYGVGDLVTESTKVPPLSPLPITIKNV